MLIHPSREVRYGCSKPKRGMLAFKLSSHKVQSVWQQLQSTYLSQGSMYLHCICPSPHDYIRSRFHKQLQQPKQRKSYLTCLRHCKTVQIPVKEKHESKLTTKFPVSFQVQLKTLSTSYTAQVASTDLQYYMLNSNTFTTAAQTTDAT